MTKKTHLTDADRLQIEILLKQRYPLSRIAEQIGKSKSTIAREIKKRAQESEKFAPLMRKMFVSSFSIRRMSATVAPMNTVVF